MNNDLNNIKVFTTIKVSVRTLITLVTRRIIQNMRRVSWVVSESEGIHCEGICPGKQRETERERKKVRERKREKEKERDRQTEERQIETARDKDC